jgi:ARG/rhodanese/phosphatase superfamily protein
MPKLKEVAPRVRVGRSISRRNLTIFPLFSEGESSPAQYMPVGAAIRTGAGKVTEISEGGSVPKLAIENLGVIPVLIIDGEELIGARQNRIANLTILAPGKKTIPIPVSCVERGRWGYQSGAAAAREFTESPDVMFHQARAQKMKDVTHSLASFGTRMSDQGGVWNAIGMVSNKLGYVSPTHAIRDVYESQKTHIDDYLRDIEPEKGQIGAIFAINGCAAGVEIFDCAETLATYLPKIVRSYALDAHANQTAVSGADESEAAQLLDSILELEAQSFPAVGLGEDLRIETDAICGGALVHDGRVVHLAAFNTVPPRPNGKE